MQASRKRDNHSVDCNSASCLHYYSGDDTGIEVQLHRKFHVALLPWIWQGCNELYPVVSTANSNAS